MIPQSLVGAQFIAPAFGTKLGVMNHAPTAPSCDYASLSNTIRLMRMQLVIAAAMGLVLCATHAQALELDPVAEAKRLEAGYARLCGVWEWTVHSHTRGHREAKTKIVLPSPQMAGVDGPSPSEIRVYGDAVYFRWDYQGGYQEDSMLLSDDRRLDGTFRTSDGSRGAVDGKRLSKCQPAGTGGASGSSGKP